MSNLAYQLSWQPGRSFDEKYPLARPVTLNLLGVMGPAVSLYRLPPAADLSQYAALSWPPCAPLVQLRAVSSTSLARARALHRSEGNGGDQQVVE